MWTEHAALRHIGWIYVRDAESDSSRCASSSHSLYWEWPYFDLEAQTLYIQSAALWKCILLKLACGYPNIAMNGAHCILDGQHARGWTTI